MDQHTPHRATATDDAPPLGRLQEVGGRRLMVHRSGSGGPAVVFVSGASAVGLDYLNLHDRVAEFTTSVIYDRAGTGWSDPAELPRTAATAAEELRDLLHAIEVPAPYLLVGHSLGGGYARRFAQLFPDEVAGLLLLEPFHEDWDAYLPEPLQLRKQAADQAAADQQVTDQQVTEQQVTDLPELTEELVEQFRGVLAGYFALWPDPVREVLVERHLSLDWLQSGVLERSNLVGLLDELADGGGTPDVPLIVFTAMGVDPGQAAFMSDRLLREQNAGKRALFAALAASVPRGEHRVLENAGHSWLHVEGEGAVIQAIRDLLDRVDR
ncbi:alpha/beta fold hydrolase [Kitasatospora kifunensis]|uniref:Pimeloyl-ACP methyl ester carboxylesterase n=1 Tax=Kitasatospora kifunensis TaxID=58351 RepID=A0A7W7VZ22_KITKI|nr:alpha/beta hydrolase [Kitasatospora kifunensis]MBB4927299.1 pimeloyl-ACP methyl ester carboxylesterase [Kitasatospora kifunensis]